MAPKAKAGSTSPQKSPQEIDRIREIIFGTQMRQYEQSIMSLQQDFQRLERHIAEQSEQLAEWESKQAKAAQALRQEMRDADGSLRNELRQLAQQLEQEKVDRTLLGELFIELGNQLKNGGSLANLLDGVLNSEAFNSDSP
ncbi:MAG: hypothetical protein H3C34_08170 [Caldilineaceae bacterium]|nr:hypothetical protein [Caldilineaceae bacterium]